MATDTKNQKVWLQSNDGATIEVGMFAIATRASSCPARARRRCILTNSSCS